MSTAKASVGLVGGGVADPGPKLLEIEIRRLLFVVTGGTTVTRIHLGLDVRVVDVVVPVAVTRFTLDVGQMGEVGIVLNHISPVTLHECVGERPAKRFGYVVDFIRVHYEQWYFPAFNVADSAITVGAGLLILDSLLHARSGAGE